MTISIDWKNVRRVLLVRLRSIGDTVLATPSLIALKRFIPDARVDILLENWVAPLLEGFDAVDEIVTVGSSGTARFNASWRIRKTKYDVVFNLHGGTTGTFFTFASGAPHRVGFATYQYSRLYNHRPESPARFWGRENMQSAEQQLALLGHVGVPVGDLPKSRLGVVPRAAESVADRLQASPGSLPGKIALIHPAAAFASKEWPAERFAAIAGELSGAGYFPVAVGSPRDTAVLERFTAAAICPTLTFHDLSLPEVTALAARSAVFVGNDSGIAHIAAAVKIPVCVIFGSSNVDHWRPWTDAPSEVVVSGAGAITNIPVETVSRAVHRLLSTKEAGSDADLSS